MQETHRAYTHSKNNTYSNGTRPNYVPWIFWKAVAVGHFWYQIHQQAGCILPPLKRWLSTELPSKSSSTIQRLERLALSSFSAGLVSGSCTHAHWPRSKLSLQRALSNLSQRWMMWECSLQSPRCFQSAGLLLSYSPIFTTGCIWSATINHMKHFIKVNDKIWLSEISADISNDNLPFTYFLSTFTFLFWYKILINKIQCR